MRTTHGFLPAYKVQAAVDAEHALIVAQQVTVQALSQRNCQSVPIILECMNLTSSIAFQNQ
jgi:hypothetical protein